MAHERARQAVKRLARKKGLSEEIIISEIEFAIAETLKMVYSEGNPQKIALWNSIPCAGNTPTAWELITYLIDTMENYS